MDSDNPPRFLVALVTPFREDGEIDLAAHARNVATLWRRSVRGFLIAGSTGEGPYLEPGERAQLVASAREALGPDAVILCGVAGETLRVARRQLDEAKNAGADAALVLTPTTLVRGRHHLVERYYLELADVSPLPLLVYSVPAFTGYEPPVDVVARLAAHPNVIGMKDSGGHPVRAAEIVAATGEGFRSYTGSSRAISLAVAAGAHGAITSSGNFAPELLVRLVDAATESVAAAAALQAELVRLCDAVEPHGIAGVKAAAAEAGLAPGLPRAPLRPLEEEAARQVREAFARWSRATARG